LPQRRRNAVSKAHLPVTTPKAAEAPIQRHAESGRTSPRDQAVAARPHSLRDVPIHAPVNATGLPDRLKSGVERLSGLAMDDVKVHYNSARPARLNALAYTQGTDIHIAPRQERHLPHEAWHVVQQKQGRVRPTVQMKGVGINDDTTLEREADQMGRMAARQVGDRPDRPQIGMARLAALGPTMAVQCHPGWDGLAAPMTQTSIWASTIRRCTPGWSRSRRRTAGIFAATGKGD